MCIGKHCNTSIHLQELLFKIKLQTDEPKIKKQPKTEKKEKEQTPKTCTCGLKFMRITKSHLESKHHKKIDNVEQKVSFTIDTDNEGNIRYFKNGVEFTPAFQPEYKETAFKDLVCRLCGITNETEDKFHETGKDNRCKSCLYKRQKELREQKKLLGGAYISQKKYY
jgi:hypothetical protein